MTAIKQSSKALLVGSSPLASVAEFFSTTTQTLSERLEQIPDGEIGFRNNFIAWQHPILPITIIKPRWGGQPSPESCARKYTLEDIKPTGYDDQAIASYATFRELSDSGKIPSNLRFQVSLPTPLNVVRGFVEDDRVCTQVDPLYEERMLQSLQRIQEHISASDLAIQWDLPTEMAVLEYERGGTQDKYWKPYFSPVKSGIFDRLTRLASAVSPDIRMGYHICYGDFGHVHFMQPADTGLMVDRANTIVQRIKPVHDVAYIHMPVPKARLDEAHYKPMVSLELHDPKLFLGVVHANDESGTRQRLETATAVYPNICGIATECGLGRTPPEEIGSVLKICASVAA